MDGSIRVSIIGDGAWGTAVALVLNSAGRKASLWSHDSAYLAEMKRRRENFKFLPGIALPDAINFEPDLAASFANADIIVNAVPSQYLRTVFGKAKEFHRPEKPLVSLTKGIEPESLKRPSEVLRDCLGTIKIAALSGPSHAEEVAREMPASLVAASDELEIARQVQQIFSTPRFRVYASNDLAGVEMASAAKNVIALAGGIIHGMGLGDNALSALVTRGLVEMARLGVALGGDSQTFSGLAGLGDLITTCISPHGRNRLVGIELARGKKLAEILADIPGIPEGVSTTKCLLALAREKGIDMPITQQVEAVLWEDKKPEQAVHDLMTRARKDEN